MRKEVNDMNNTEEQSRHDIRKKEIEEEIQSLSNVHLSESFSASAVKSFQKKTV